MSSVVQLDVEDTSDRGVAQSALLCHDEPAQGKAIVPIVVHFVPFVFLS